MKHYNIYKQGNKVCYLNPPHCTRFRVWKEAGQYIVRNNKTGKQKAFTAEEFVFGRPEYNKATKKYPAYVHIAVWTIQEVLR